MDGCTSARRVLIRSEENDLSEGVFEHYFWGSTFRITSLLLPPSLPFFFFSCPTVSHSSPRRGDPMFSNEDKFLLLLFLSTRGGGIVDLHDAPFIESLTFLRKRRGFLFAIRTNFTSPRVRAPRKLVSRFIRFEICLLFLEREGRSVSFRIMDRDTRTHPR